MVYIAASWTASRFDGEMGDFCAVHYSEMAVNWQPQMAIQNGCKLMYTASDAAERYGSSLPVPNRSTPLQFSCISAAQRCSYRTGRQEKNILNCFCHGVCPSPFSLVHCFCTFKATKCYLNISKNSDLFVAAQFNFSIHPVNSRFILFFLNLEIRYLRSCRKLVI